MKLIYSFEKCHLIVEGAIKPEFVSEKESPQGILTNADGSESSVVRYRSGDIALPVPPPPIHTLIP